MTSGNFKISKRETIAEVKGDKFLLSVNELRPEQETWNGKSVI